MDDSWTTKEVRSPYGVGLWRTIRDLWPKIWRNSKIDIGNGRKTFFWNDVWVGQHSLKQLHPEIYNLNQQKEATVAEVKDNQGWNLSFRRRLNDWEIDKLEDFYKSLEQASNLDAKEDSLQWLRANNGKFTIKSAYRHFDRPAEMLLPWPWKMIWKINVPHKVACFTWLVAREAVLTQDNLMKRGRQLCSRCFFCEIETETKNHLFLHCRVTEKLWQVFLNLRGISWSMPRHTSDFLAC